MDSRGGLTFGNEKNLLPLTGFEPRIARPVGLFNIATFICTNFRMTVNASFNILLHRQYRTKFLYYVSLIAAGANETRLDAY